GPRGAAPGRGRGGARRRAAGSRRVVVVDDLDHGGPEAVEFLAVLAGRLTAGSTPVVVTACEAPGAGRRAAPGRLDRGGAGRGGRTCPGRRRPRPVGGLSGAARGGQVAGR